VTPLVRSAGGWKNLSLLGMTTYALHKTQTDSVVWIQKRSVKKETILWVLGDMKKKYEHSGHPFILLWDGLPAHRAKMVQECIQQNKHWLTVYRFPAYAPELNPQEYQWSALKRKDLGNYCPKSMNTLAQKARRGIARTRKQPETLKGFLKKSGLWSGKELGEGQ
jgi:transposase